MEDKDASWNIPDHQLDNWAKQMERRLQNLFRHVRQALSSDNPPWARIVMGGSGSSDGSEPRVPVQGHGYTSFADEEGEEEEEMEIDEEDSDCGEESEEEEE